MRAKSNRVGEGTGRRFQGRRKGKAKSFCFVVIQFELIFRHPCFYVVCACIEFFGEVGHFIERSGFLELSVICEKLMVYRVVCYDIGERRSVQDKENACVCLVLSSVFQCFSVVCHCLSGFADAWLVRAHVFLSPPPPPPPTLFMAFIRSKTNGAFNDLMNYFGPFFILFFCTAKEKGTHKHARLASPKGSQAL